ncbi:MAG: cation:proton antiporter [bacterium]
MHGLLEDIGISIIFATFFGILAHKIRQPVILGYLMGGALIGPETGLRFVTNAVNIETISGIGLVLLLFIIGLEINLKRLIHQGRQIIVAGIGQFILCILLGLLFFKYILGEGRVNSFYLALLCSVSSTAIVVKLLYDKFEIDTLPGRITLGILIIQDIWVILLLAFQSNFLEPKIAIFFLGLLKAPLLLGGGFLLSKYLLKHVFEWVAKSPEMVVAISIAWCSLISTCAEFIGLSKEIGAFIAGISISIFPYSLHVTAKVLPLRDFFLILFFISLGMKIQKPSLEIILNSLVIVAFVIASRFLTLYPLLLLNGAGKRTSFISSLNLSQISEFSLVIAAIGTELGHIQKNILNLIICSMAFGAILSSYFIKANHETYLVFDKITRRLGFKSKEEGYQKKKTISYPIVILGFHHGARALIDAISQKNPSLLSQVLVIDFSLEVLRELKEKNISAIFGDVSSVETLRHAHIEETKIILSTIPDVFLKGIDNLKLVKICRSLSPSSTIIATADSLEQAEKIKEQGANEVLLVYSIFGEELVLLLEEELKESDS